MIWIDGNVPSLKNSKVKTSRGIFPSKTVQNYIRDLGIQSYSVSKKIVKGYVRRDNLFEQLRPEFEEAMKDKETPYRIGFHFVRRTKHKFDFHNMVQILADLMVAHDFIEDDNMEYFIPIPMRMKGEFYHYDKEKPGVYIKIY
mgnify:CR=1 FL=1